MKTITGNLTHVTEGIIVHGCNAKGKMASGVAKDIREVFPSAYEAYMKRYHEKGLKVGDVVWARIASEKPLAVANAITQESYGRDKSIRYVDYDGLRKAFKSIGDIARKYSLPVYYPMIGAGLANGDWGIISKIIEEELHDVDHTFYRFEEPNPLQSKGFRP